MLAGFSRRSTAPEFQFDGGWGERVAFCLLLPCALCSRSLTWSASPCVVLVARAGGVVFIQSRLGGPVFYGTNTNRANPPTAHRTRATTKARTARSRGALLLRALLAPLAKRELNEQCDLSQPGPCLTQKATRPSAIIGGQGGGHDTGQWGKGDLA